MNNNEQMRINALSAALRRKVILVLLKQQFAMHRQQLPSEEQLAYEIEQVFALPVCTKYLRRLYEDGNAYRRDAGLFPSVPTLYDLQFCIKKRYAVMGSSTATLGWLPAKEDSDLLQLPEFKELAKIYLPYAKEGKRLPPPSEERPKQDALLQIVSGKLKTTTK